VRGDISKAPFPDAYFDGITSLSVIEHGVDIDAYFSEMSRLLRPGGLLLTSTDYWPDKIQNKEKIEAYGQPVFIFSQLEIEEAVSKAAQHGLHPTGGIDFKAQNKTIGWLGFEYTFIIFTLQKC
ncbi:MAG: class I SAM-dependent methyltransferase, partial [Verrucomicrobiota bacterium]|nr:class I SAM-dependent methyltransferase [Verrucomicrobiota bacterium]